ncbi:MAG: PKD domain-containing protein [Gammaproteobacteria bacterium]|nr:PKD domain-containing protein [Gammaproteobacteria bacterium]
MNDEKITSPKVFDGDHSCLCTCLCPSVPVYEVNVRFIITGGKEATHYIIDSARDGRLEDLVSWTSSSLITANAWNHLMIAKSGNEFLFSINYTEVERLNIDWCTGGGVGVHASHSLDAAFDNFRVKELSSAVEPASNQAPTANAAISPDQGKAPLTVHLDGSGSYDPDGQIISYAWTIDGQVLSGMTVDAVLQAPGEYTVSLTVTDNLNATGFTSKTVSVSTETDPPPQTADLRFTEFVPLYNIGDYVTINLEENLNVNRLERVDLWIAVKLPDNDVIFMTPYAFAPFSPNPQPYRISLESTSSLSGSISNLLFINEFMVYVGFVNLVADQ